MPSSNQPPGESWWPAQSFSYSDPFLSLFDLNLQFSNLPGRYLSNLILTRNKVQRVWYLWRQLASSQNPAPCKPRQSSASRRKRDTRRMEAEHVFSNPENQQSPFPEEKRPCVDDRDNGWAVQSDRKPKPERRFVASSCRSDHHNHHLPSSGMGA